MNIDQWRRRKQKPYVPDYETQKHLSINYIGRFFYKFFYKIKLESFLKEDDVINKTTVKVVITTLMDLVEKQSNHAMNFAPHFR